jgi:hypothetical protein
MSAKVEATPALPGLSQVCGKPIIARFDGDQHPSDAGVLAPREIECCLGNVDRLANCIADPRAAGRVILPSNACRAWSFEPRGTVAPTEPVTAAPSVAITTTPPASQPAGCQHARTTRPCRRKSPSQVRKVRDEFFGYSRSRLAWIAKISSI